MMSRRSAFVLSAIALSVIGDSVVYVLLLLSASRLAVSWWVTGVVLTNLLPPVLLAPILGSLVDRATGRTAWISAMVDARHLRQAWAMVGAGFSAFSAIGNVLGTPAIWGGARPAVLIAGAIGTLAAIATMLAHRTVGAPQGSQCHDA